MSMIDLVQVERYAEICAGCEENERNGMKLD